MSSREKQSAELFRLTNARVQRNGKTILDIDSFVIREGERIALLGPNGAGKSTLIRVLTRQILPLYQAEPPVRILGQDRPIITDINKIVGVVSAEAQRRTRVRLSVFELVEGGLFGALRVPPHRRASYEHHVQTLAVLRDLGISHLVDRDVTTLSTGQARLVLIAKALVHNPRVLVLDEPCSGLDPHATWMLRETMQVLGKQGRTLLLVTHRVEDIMPTFNRAVLMQDARILHDGQKSEVLTTQAMTSLFNLPAVLEEQDGMYHLWEKHTK